MHDYVEDLLGESESMELDDYYSDAMEADIHEEDELDECACF
ncbi:hypothetical protein [Teredinibacter turnerae]|uniref:Uncharacterized protein n=1 Tax=Teredinibacter turnerae (strain ATCC 39867 / T7901) TaxID=377629 RepID=C5BL14_TERTT|nr:hypothetical protein [Teredinibacter turnerae]ACR14482.1 hypothetical protein TERTU_2449 [Teredinibacter turnerae T7901]